MAIAIFRSGSITGTSSTSGGGSMYVCMFYLGPFSINGVQYIQCDMILNTWTKARTWKSYDCY